MSGIGTGTYAEQFGEGFQRHVLAVAARHVSFIIRFRSALDASYWHTDLHRIVAKALLAHVDHYHSLPTIETLAEDCRTLTDDDTMSEVESLLAQIFEEDLTDTQAVMDKAVDFGQTQAMVNAVIEASEEIDRGSREKVRPLIEAANLVGHDILDTGINMQVTDRVKLYADDELGECIPTGITHVDWVLGGGLGRGELGCVLAPPKRGKTTTLVNFGYGAAAAGYNVVHYTCEMRGKKVGRRYDDRMAGPLFPLKFKDRDAYAAAIADRAGKLLKGQLFVKEYPTRTMTPSMIRGHLSILHAHGFVPDLLIVDYADIMRAERRLGDPRHEVAGIYEDLRTIGGEYNAGVWTASQVKQAMWEAAMYELNAFAEAFEKAGIIDAGLAFCQTKDERRDNRCRFFFAGLREGADLSTAVCHINRSRCFIRSLSLYDYNDQQIVTPHDAETGVAHAPQEEMSARVRKAGDARTRLAGHGSKLPRKKTAPPVPHKFPKKKGKGPKRRKGPQRKIIDNG